jgi:hypothetical protein
MKALASLLLALACSCGASAGEVKTAQTTAYAAEPATLFTEMKAAVEGTYKVAQTDQNTLALRTETRWYTPDGQIDTKAGANPSSVQDKSINLVFVVGLVKVDARSYKVGVEPIILRKNELSSAPEQLKLDDPTVPGWVKGKTDTLQLEIYRRLKGYAVVEPVAEPGPSHPMEPKGGGW